MPIQHEYVAMTVSFQQDMGIEIEWTDVAEHDEAGGTFHRSQITREGQEANQQVAYWAAELRQDVEELLEAWIKERRVGPDV